MFKQILAIMQLLMVSIFTIISILLFFWAFLIPRQKREQTVMELGGQRWANFVLSYLGIKVAKSGLGNIPQKNQGYLSISNHLSFIDILLLMSSLKCTFMLKTSLFWIPFGWGAYLTGAVGVKRGNPKNQVKAMYKALEMSKKSIGVHVFPEGTRSRTGELLPLKKGMLGLAYKRKIPVLISGIWGTQHIAPSKRIELDISAPCSIHVHGILAPEDCSNMDEFIQKCAEFLNASIQIAKESLKNS